jgi:serine/threonine protein kinase
MFATEYAPLGDLTSNTTEAGLGEQHTKRVARQVMTMKYVNFLAECSIEIFQVGSALEWIHSKGLCHLDVKLDNILVFR